MVKCYTQYNDAIHEQSNWFPVGHSSNGNEFFPCCDEGDIGLDSSICQYSESSPGGSTYYVAGCTDPSYNASVCSEYCNFQVSPDIVYSEGSSLWSCCGEDTGGNVNCQFPTDYSFQLVPPDLLEEVGTADPSNSASLEAARPTPVTVPTGIVTISGTREIPSSTETPTAPAAAPADTGLSTGAKAGIGVGAAVGGLLIIAVIVMAFLLGRRHRGHRAAELSGSGSSSSDRGAYVGANQHGGTPTTTALRSPGSATVVGSESGRSGRRGFGSFFLLWRRRNRYGEEKWELGQGQGARSELGEKNGDVAGRLEKGRDTPERDRSRRDS